MKFSGRKFLNIKNSLKKNDFSKTPSRGSRPPILSLIAPIFSFFHLQPPSSLWLVCKIAHLKILHLQNVKVSNKKSAAT